MLKRSAFKAKAQVRPAPRDRSDEFASFSIDRPTARVASLLRAEPPRIAAPAIPAKVPNRVQTNIRDAARGEPCTVRLPGCPGDPSMSIWSHNRHSRAGKGCSIKAIDLNGAICCTRCDAIYDGQVPLPTGWTRADVELAWYHGHAESLVRLLAKGVL